MPEEQVLNDADKSKVFHEELYRTQIRAQLGETPDNPTRTKKLWDFVNSAFFLWLLSSVFLGLVTFFYTKLDERHKERQFQLEQQASLKEATFESLSTDLSGYLFYSDVLTKGFEEKWWKPSGLKAVLPKYNDAIGSLRGKEYLYRGKVERLWSTREEAQLAEAFAQVRRFDDLIHKLNVEIGAATSDHNKDIDFAVLDKVVTSELRPAVDALEQKSKALLSALANGLELPNKAR